MNPAARDELRAYHEAGHAVVARVLGVSVTHVTILSTKDDNSGAAQTRSAAWLARDTGAPARIAALRKDALVALAGPHAQVRHRPQTNIKRATSKEWKDDIANVMNALGLAAGHAGSRPLAASDRIPPELIPEVQCLWSQVEPESQKMVEEYWPAIERVAKALLTHRVLHQGEVDALIWSAAA
jgi:hypothetical protein